MSALKAPAAAAERYVLAPGVVALAPGLAWLPQTRTLVAADAHLAYEDVIGGTLPLWSTAEIVATLALVATRMDAREVVFLGDIVHGARMSEGAIRTVRDALDVVRALAMVTLVAGNHEGRSRAFAVLGATVESCERAGTVAPPPICKLGWRWRDGAGVRRERRARRRAGAHAVLARTRLSV
ncbi:MAG: hypothetical protein NVSMB59_08360 [Vulcanimicrobiaceae bacterium]